VLADATQAFADFNWLHTATVATQGQALGAHHRLHPLLG
jgi:hypothetical protein